MSRSFLFTRRPWATLTTTSILQCIDGSNDIPAPVPSAGQGDQPMLAKHVDLHVAKDDLLDLVGGVDGVDVDAACHVRVPSDDLEP